MLIYLYTLEKPSIVDQESDEFNEVDEAETWRNALGLYDIANKYDIEPLADAVYKALLERAPQLCAAWSTSNQNTKEEHFSVIRDVWLKYPEDHQMTILKTSIMKALANVADLIAGYPALTALLTCNKSFATEYINALSTEIGRKRKRV